MLQAGKLLAPPASPDRWLLVQTHFNAERAVRSALTAPYRACTVYLPLMLVTVMHARRRQEVEKSFLPRYLFVKDEEMDLSKVRYCPGVTHLAKRGGNLIMVPQWVIDQIKARETVTRGIDGKPRAYVDLDVRLGPAPVIRFSKGETVRVSDGPFASFNGMFERWLNGEQRAAILVNIFGRHTPVELEPSQFEKL